MRRLALAVAVLAAPVLAQQSSAPRGAGRLARGQVVERELAAGQTDEFSVEVPAGQYLRVSAARRGIDLEIELVAPNRALAAKAESPNRFFGQDMLSALAPAKGIYRIRLTAKSGLKGSYRVELAELRPPAAADRSRIRAETDLHTATARLLVGEKAANQEAGKLFGQAAAEWRDLHDDQGQAISLSGQAASFILLGQARQALPLAMQALALFRSVRDQAGEALALTQTGVADSALGDNKKGLADLDPAVALFSSMGDSAGESEALLQRGYAWSGLGDQQKALADLNRSLELRRAAGDEDGAAVILAAIALANTSLGENQKAVGYLEQALPALRSSGDRVGQSLVLDAMGSAWSALGDKAKAADLYLQALALRRVTGNQDDEAETLNNLGTLYAGISQPQKAIDYFSQALVMSRAAEDRFLEANVLASLGAEYGNVGQRSKAIEFLDQALPLLDALGDPVGKALTLTNKANLQSAQGQYQKALPSFEQALALQVQTQDKVGQALTMLNFGNVYSLLGNYDKALEYYGRALDIYRELKDPHGQATALNDLGLVSWKRKEFAKALEYDSLALPLARSTQDKSSEALILHNMSVSSIDLGNEEKARALEFSEQALPLARSSGDRNAEAGALLSVGYAAFALDDGTKALESYELAVTIFREIGDRASEAAVLSLISKVLRRRETGVDTAICFLKEAVNLIQSIRRDNRGLSDDLRHSYAVSIESIYRDLAGLLIDERRFGEAEEVLNLLKEQETLSFVQRDALADQLRPLSLRDFEKKALEEYDRHQSEVVPTGQRLAPLLAKAESAAPLTPEETELRRRLTGELSSANLLFVRYFEEVQNSFPPRTARIFDLKDADALQSTLRSLGPDVVAIYTLVLPDRYVAELITGGSRRIYITKIKEADFNKKIFAFRQQLQTPSADPAPLASELYRIVFPETLGEDLDRIHARTIMWSVDGALRYVPIAALRDDKGYLVARFRNSLITPPSLARLTDISSPNWKGVGFGVSKSKSADFPDLPSVPEEMRRIFAQDGSAPVQGSYLLNADFTQASLLKTLSQSPKQVVHISTHYDSRAGLYDNSRMLLGDGTQLTLGQIEANQNLFAGVELLTLSACNTAFTDNEEDGREVDSLGTIAQRLGAKSVVASLWEVNDAATAHLMEAMYRVHKEHPDLGKSEALRLAQQQMAAGLMSSDAAQTRSGREPSPGNRGWAHPCYWAPFILIGNWR
jgi:CHAT domain-containing protein/Tfp pilus assembly protein PilF